jgi:hypothetical protein
MEPVVINSSKQWDPKEWEDHINLILQIHHGLSNYFRIPDKHKGDAGIEGYSMDGSAYQAYAPEQCRVHELYEKQRTKLTTDINKFIKNKAELEKLIYKTKVKRWVLVVPNHVSKELNKIANEKSELVLSHGLPYVDSNDFRVQILDRADFKAEEKVLLDLGLNKLKIEHAEITQIDANSYEIDESENIENINRKLGKLPGGKDTLKLSATREELIKRFIASENILDNLRYEFPQYHQDIETMKSKRESSLLIESISSLAPPTLKDEANKLIDIFNKQSILHDDNYETIAWGTITEWLMRCPLDFD